MNNSPSNYSISTSITSPSNYSISSPIISSVISPINSYIDGNVYYDDCYNDYCDNDINIAIMCDDVISIVSDLEIDEISKESSKNSLNNIIENKIFDRKNYKKELIKKNTFLNKKQYQIEFNKLILNIYKIKLLDKIILTFI